MQEQISNDWDLARNGERIPTDSTPARSIADALRNVRNRRGQEQGFCWGGIPMSTTPVGSIADNQEAQGVGETCQRGVTARGQEGGSTGENIPTDATLDGSIVNDQEAQGTGQTCQQATRRREAAKMLPRERFPRVQHPKYSCCAPLPSHHQRSKPLKEVLPFRPAPQKSNRKPMEEPLPHIQKGKSWILRNFSSHQITVTFVPTPTDFTQKLFTTAAPCSSLGGSVGEGVVI